MKDRRCDIRVAEENKVILTVLAGRDPGLTGTVFYSFTRDISAGGARILTGARLEPGDRVRLEIALSGSRKTIRTAGEVRWAREIYEKEVFETGIAFVDLDPESEIALIDHVYGRPQAKRSTQPRSVLKPGRDQGEEPA